MTELLAVTNVGGGERTYQRTLDTDWRRDELR